MQIKNIDEIKEFSEKGFLKRRIWQTENLQCNIYTFKPKGVNPIHRHPGSDEVVFCMEGEGEIVMEDERETIRAKDAVLIPVNKAHGFVNTGNKRMIIVVLQCPTPVGHIAVEAGSLAD
ncbi:MAG: cupin domain-containing protein [Candidatus Marinimicrobia bacterium]|nr:cupin domain-containing protein [Candidatus Neomarinimicrobiota bacterium]